jgi:hypothetical protein
MELQDGGLVANNPSSLASNETKSLFRGQLPDYAVSFGTGMFDAASGAPARWISFVPEWIRRLGTCWAQQMNADTQYLTFYASLSDQEKERHHRIQPVFSCPAVALDDSSAIPMLQRLTRREMFRSPSMTNAMRHLACSMIAKVFYPVLQPDPVFDKGLGLHSMHLAVVSRWEDNLAVSARLRDYLSEASFHIQGAEYPARTPLEITLALSSLDDKLDIDLRFKDGTRHKISGLPLSARQILLLQHQEREGYWLCNTGSRHKRACPDQEAELLYPRKRARWSKLPTPASTEHSPALSARCGPYFSFPRI